jgi:site-specific DNA-methyltransferase (adenine-specific)
MEYSGYDQKFESGGIRLYQADCMEMLPQVPDKYYDLCICDPPYGSAMQNMSRTGGTWAVKYRKIKEWDYAPDEKYFTELFRVCQHIIIWGGNYFNLPPSRNFIIWKKLTISETFTMAMAEYAWTNIEGNSKVFEYAPQDKNRFHPTQKPVALYQWLLKNYAKQGDRILDTHGGSCSIAIACDIMGFDADIWEIDADYYRAAVERFERHKQQTVLEFA